MPIQACVRLYKVINRPKKLPLHRKRKFPLWGAEIKVCRDRFVEAVGSGVRVTLKEGRL